MKAKKRFFKKTVRERLGGVSGMGGERGRKGYRGVQRMEVHCTA
jgi:hypothetical protein